MEAEGPAGVGKEREIGGFNWAGFFSNRYILLQILLYVYLFYTKLPGIDEVGPLLLKELAARHQRQDLQYLVGCGRKPVFVHEICSRTNAGERRKRRKKEDECHLIGRSHHSRSR